MFILQNNIPPLLLPGNYFSNAGQHSHENPACGYPELRCDTTWLGVGQGPHGAGGRLAGSLSASWRAHVENPRAFAQIVAK